MANKTCNPNAQKANLSTHICNPTTGRWVKRTGKIGKALSPRVKQVKQVKQVKRVKQARRKKCGKCKTQLTARTGNILLHKTARGVEHRVCGNCVDNLEPIYDRHDNYIGLRCPAGRCRANTGY